MSDETSSKQTSSKSKECCGKKVMLAYEAMQISATVRSAIPLAVIALGFCTVKQESKVFKGCVEEVIAQGKTNTQVVRFVNGGN